MNFKNEEKPLIEHVSELLERARKILYSVIISALVISILPANINDLSASKYKPLISLIMERIKEDLLPEGVNLITYSWIEVLTVYIALAVMMGVLISSPIIAYEIYKFVNPALFPDERKYLTKFVAIFMLLSFFGGVYAYLVLLPITFVVLERLSGWTGALPFYSIKSFYYFVVLSILGSAIFFTMPIFLTFLVKYDVIDLDTLRRNRTKVFFAVLIITAILTPDPTPLTMLLLSLPFILLYEISILVSSHLKR
ncbi:MAG TPA: hypothetical protein EYP68_00065 [Candidatus Korarchaeota archaeon]|nr:hypothetical protein [Candidatus Korarchaeota archaeon]